MVMDIHGNDFPLVFHLLRQMGCLAAWGSTKIKDQVPGLGASTSASSMELSSWM